MYSKIGAWPIYQNEPENKYKKSSSRYKKLFGVDCGIGVGLVPVPFSSSLYGKFSYEYDKNLAMGVTAGISHARDTVHYRRPNLSYLEILQYYNLVYSGGLLFRYTALNLFMVQLEPRFYYSKHATGINVVGNKIEVVAERFLKSGLNLGAGFCNSSFLNIITNFYVNYDLLQNRLSPYYNRLDIRFGFMLPIK